MNQILKNCLLMILSAAAMSAIAADDQLKIIDNPGGGSIVYGPLAGEQTVQTAMG